MVEWMKVDVGGWQIYRLRGCGSVFVVKGILVFGFGLAVRDYSASGQWSSPPGVIWSSIRRVCGWVWVGAIYPSCG